MTPTLRGAGAVLALVLLQWVAGLAAVGAWSQSWSVVRRGHFRIVAWTVAALALAAMLSLADALSAARGTEASSARALGWALVGAAAVYLAVQYSRTDLPGIAAGSLTAAIGAALLATASGLLGSWDWWAATLQMIAGAALLGGVTNGMLLGHWYLNQPGLKPWALSRLTDLTLAATAAAGLAGVAFVARLISARTEGAVLGLPGFGENFGAVFYAVWAALLGFTAAVVWMARRCVSIRSIQSATGLYYVALLTAGVTEFVARYLLVNST